MIFDLFISLKICSMKKSKQVVIKEGSLPLVNPFAAGIDAGDTLHSVAIAEGLDKDRVRTFGTMTCDLESIAAWLLNTGIQTVAIESTGVYWKPLFSLLNRKGIEVYLVNAREVKNVSGRKTDESDAVWLQKLHSFGLLKTAFLPDDEQDALRSLVRYRHTLVQDCSRFKNRMQKSLELMNIKFHTLFADLFGKTSSAFIEAILGGEREPSAFLRLVKGGIKADKEKILQSLQGNWRSEHLFTLRQSYEMHRCYQQRISECDTEIENQLQQYEASINEGEVSPKEPVAEQPLTVIAKKKKQRGAPVFNVRQYLEKIYGTDVMAIYGISDMGGLEILAETGADLSKWPTKNHFVSWLNLCPNNKQSGGKLISSHLMKKKPNAASQAFRIAANTLQRSNHWLGDFFRRMKSRGGNKYAVVATANKIATIFYLMVTQKQQFTPVDLDAYQKKQQQSKIAYYERKLNELKTVAA
jgi:transposase